MGGNGWDLGLADFFGLVEREQFSRFRALLFWLPSFQSSSMFLFGESLGYETCVSSRKRPRTLCYWPDEAPCSRSPLYSSKEEELKTFEDVLPQSTSPAHLIRNLRGKSARQPL